MTPTALDRYRNQLRPLLMEYQVAIKNISSESSRSQELIQEQEHLKKSLSIAQEVAVQVQEACHGRVSEIASRCLEAVFGKDTYSLRIDFEDKRGRTEATLTLLDHGREVEDPLGSCGGGVIDVSAFALRLACLLLSRTRRRTFLALDEPFRFVSEEYQDRVRFLLETLSRELGLQILFVTHNRRLVTGSVVRTRPVDSGTEYVTPEISSESHEIDR